MDYDKLVDEMIDSLNEAQQMKAKRTTITKVTRQTKIDRAIGALATKFAKEANDPLYKKLVKFREKFFKYRKMIRTKYAPRVRSRAIQGKGISDMLAKYKKKKPQALSSKKKKPGAFSSKKKKK